MKNQLLAILTDPKIKFILNENANLDHNEFALKYAGRKDLPVKDIAEQIDCRTRAKKKLGNLATFDLIFKKRALEQCSSEITAEFKAGKLSGEKIIDITGGLGIDCIYFARNFEEVHYCEIDEELCTIAEYNFKKLGIDNIKIHCGNGLDIIDSFPNNYFDWCFCDPSRRNAERRSVDINFLEPDVVSNLDLLKRKSKGQCFKLAPAFDFQEAVRIFPEINEFLIVSVDNEIKETLIIISRKKSEQIKSAVVLGNSGQADIVSSDFNSKLRKNFTNIQPGMYFYDPDRAIKKINLSSLIAKKFNLNFINHISNYLIANNHIDNFPGRIFRIVYSDKFNEKRIKQFLKSEGIAKANVARDNFPLKPEDILKKLKLKQGGNEFFFFTKNLREELIFIRTHKLD